MATYSGTQRGRAQHNTNECGNAWLDSNQVTPSAALATTDVVVGLEVPAGVELNTLRFRAGDMDTGTTLTMNIGYRSKLPGGALVAAPTAFAAASAAFQASTLTAWQELVFAPIKFNEPVEITLIPAANATGVSGTPSIYVQGTGQVVGIS